MMSNNLKYLLSVTLLTTCSLAGCEQAYHGGFTINPYKPKPKPQKISYEKAFADISKQNALKSPPPANKPTIHTSKITASPQTLTANPHELTTQTDPTTKPDTSKPVFVSAKSPQITSSRADLANFGEIDGQPAIPPSGGTENIRQVSFSREGADFDVTISPDGKNVYFASTQHSHTSNIYRKSTTGTTITQITSDPANDVMPAVSPDGKTIAFCSDRNGNWDIFIKSAHNKPIQLTNSPTHELHPSWSPDGKWIVFSTLSSRSGLWELTIVDARNPAQRHILGPGLFPEFSPTGDKIAFQRARHRGSRAFSIWTIDFNNGESFNPTEIASATNAAAISPTWSPDGKYIAFTTILNPAAHHISRKKRTSLWTISIDGTQRTRLTNDQFANAQPVWSSTGEIYFISSRTGTDNIWQIRPSNQQIFTADQKNSDNIANPQVNVPTE